MTREQIRQKIYDFLLHKGADRFWAASALKHVMLNMAGNTWWLTEIRSPNVVIGQFGIVDKLTLICTINSIKEKVKGRLTYTFGKGHKVRVRPVK